MNMTRQMTNIHFFFVLHGINLVKFSIRNTRKCVIILEVNSPKINWAQINGSMIMWTDSVIERSSNLIGLHWSTSLRIVIKIYLLLLQWKASLVNFFFVAFKPKHIIRIFLISERDLFEKLLHSKRLFYAKI